ncbi:MAG TPA: NADPH-dependent F420 reductase [Candidatus Limnocylindria bacterium]|jgi:predicted dinucleotide-binding enzyme|nr:NADPH-dependent F420 reductase [Candidatus Limnocylindria bacterium]
MQIGILGSGNIGGNAARLFARAGHHVRIANSRGPQTLRALVEEIGANAEATSAQTAVDASDLVLIAVPWTKREEALGEIEGWDEKIVVDAMNPYTEDFEIEDLGSKTSSEFIRALVPGARVVKAFNTMFYKRLASEGKPAGKKDRLALPVASDDPAAKRVVMDLIDEIGFDAVDSGGLVEGGRKQQPGSPIYNQPLTAKELKERLARA